MVKERRSKNIGRKQRQKNNTHKRRVSKRNTLRRKSFRGGRPLPEPAASIADFFKYEKVYVDSEEIGKIKVDEIITNTSVLYDLKHDDLVTVKMVGNTETGKIFFPYTTRINTFDVKGSGLGFRSAFASKNPTNKATKYFNRIKTERDVKRYDRAQNLIGEEITDKDELSKVKTLFEALKGYLDL